VSKPVVNNGFSRLRFLGSITHIRPVNTAKIIDNLYAVKTGIVNFFIYKSDGDIICIDSGFRKNLIIRELNSLGIDPKSITHLFLTHSDFDHTNGLALFEKAKIYLSSDEEQMITRQKARMLGFIYNSKIERPYHLLKDNDIVAVGSIKIRAISTPGHTTGSMSYLINESVLFVGDTFKLVDNKVCSLRRYINMNTEQQKESIRKLACFDNVYLACTAHTGYTKEFNEAISDWLSTFSNSNPWWKEITIRA
jgi:hydroxyacylglutathione hydrolase